MGGIDIFGQSEMGANSFFELKMGRGKELFTLVFGGRGGVSIFLTSKKIQGPGACSGKFAGLPK